MGKKGLKLSQIVLVRLGEVEPPPKKTVSLTAFSVFFNPSLTIVLKIVVDCKHRKRSFLLQSSLISAFERNLRHDSQLNH